MKAPVTYLALHKEGLRNGSFYRSNRQDVDYPYVQDGWVQYINGDFMGFVSVRPVTYCGLLLKEFTEAEALKLIPECCGGKR